jgi:hypothetical protein
LKISSHSHSLAFVTREHLARKITDEADSLKTDFLQGKPGKVLNNSTGLGQTKSAMRDNPLAKQIPPGILPEKTDASLVSLLKLPQDGLSRSIIAFARFFSLPLEPKLLATLRREALSAKTSGREAAALGATAAKNKGIKLGERALAEYAAAIEGKNFDTEEAAAVPASANEPQNGGRGGSPREDSQANDTTEQEPGQEPDSQEAGAGNGNNNRNSGSFRDKDNLQDIDDKELQRRITEILRKRPFLDLINRIPGKNGQWIVVPFSFSDDGFDFNVSLRILVNRETGKALVSGRLSADIKVSRLGREQKRWLVTLEKAEKDSDVSAELSVFSGSRSWYFSKAEKKQVRLKLAAALDLPLNKVSIREEGLTGEAALIEAEALIGEAIPILTGSRENALRSVNEEV